MVEIGEREIVVVFNSMIEHPSGGDSRVIELCKRFKSFFSLKVILSEDSADYFEKENLTSLILARTSRFRKKYGYPAGMAIAYFLRLWQAIFVVPKFKQEIIFYAPSDLFVDVIPVVLGKILNPRSKYVQVVHHLVPRWRERGRGLLMNLITYCFQNVSLAIARCFADLVFVVNPDTKNQLSKKGFRNKIVMAGNGIDLENIRKIYSSTKTSKRYEGVFLGRLQFSKGVMDLPEIWRKVVEKKKGAKLVVIGNALPEVAHKMENKIRQYKLEKNIDLLGYVSRERMIKTLKASRLFVYPSREEGWGIVVAEAMACRLPVVAYNLPAYKALFPKGMVVHEIGDYKKFSSTILMLLGDRQKCQKLSKSAYEISRNYSWEKVADKEIKEINLLYKDAKEII